MSTNEFLRRFLLSNKAVDLVKKIAAKSQEGKIVWQKTTNGSAAYVPGALRMNFVDAPLAGLFLSRWVLFIIRDEVGNELLKVENQSSALLPGSIPLLPMPAQDPLVSAVSDLHYVVLSQQGKEGIDRAIDVLDKL